MDKKYFLIVGELKEYLVRGTAAVLHEHGHVVDLVPPNERLYVLNLSQYQCCIIFVDSASQTLHSLGAGNCLLGYEDLRVCLVGAKEEIAVLSRSIAGSFDCALQRPVDANSIAATAENAADGKIGRQNVIGKCVMVLSANQMLLNKLQRILKNAYRVFALYSLETAGTVIQRMHMDLVILDFSSFGGIVDCSFLDAGAERPPLMALLDRDDIVEIAKSTLTDPVDYLFKTMTARKMMEKLHTFFMTGRKNDFYTRIRYVEPEEDRKQ